MSNYKSSLNLPQTGFPMRGELSKREPLILQHWYEKDLYGLIRQAKKGKKTFILHDGPPYANGSIHIGHAVNKILKDIIIKSKGFSGFDSPYIPGWDCHGQPIELKVEQLIGQPGKKFSAAEFRIKCREYAYEQIKSQKADFQRLGVLGDWDHPYLTMAFETEANIIRALAKIIANGHLIKGSKPVHWCPECRSSLAEAEVEYQDQISLSIYVRFFAVDKKEILNKFGVKNAKGKCYLLIWTTTPWTIPANRAVALHPEYEYQLVQIKTECLIIATNLVNKVMKSIGNTFWVILGSCKGINLEKQYVRHPFMSFNVPIVLSKHVMREEGTGAVHIAPAHGPDDYIVGQKYGLETLNPVGPDGCYIYNIDSGMHILDGLFVLKANDVIVDLLKKYETLLYVEKIHHSYPYCWRHKKPIFFRATPQWFISMDHKDLRKQALDNINKIEQVGLKENKFSGWIPSWGKLCIETMVANRPDWCISRQRTWGVPMSIFVHKKTHKLHPRTIELMESVAQLVEKSGIQAWWDLDIKNFLGAESEQYEKVSDILDVWFDSGSTHFSVVDVRPEFHGDIADIYLEGSDQHRGWFMSSLIISTAIKGKAPYRQVLTHGFTVDHERRKMSKSIGNTFNPQDVITKLGGDILRLWVASTDYTSEIVVSHEILKNFVDSYRRIRNTARFLLANLNGFNPIKHMIKPEDMVLLDRWAVERAMKIQKKIIEFYDSYNFHGLIKCLLYFCSVEMGSFYLDIIKDRQYTSKANSLSRRSCQTALFHIIEALVRWIAPILSFTADELWNYIPGERSIFVFTEEWYKGLFSLSDTGLMNNKFWATLLKVRSEVNKVIEQARKDKFIGSSLEGKVILYTTDNLMTQLNSLQDELRFVFITSGAQVMPLACAPERALQSDIVKGLKISLSKAEGHKCPRCWHFYTEIYRNTRYPDLCIRCESNLIGYGEKRKFV
ncbi:isoleucine--tRNA ligase [Candidatus Profftia sp. (ex Adelges kitamiensis)]|uniref:isoleucine--tRNA ligase n=1 Tax=Candidatus Profftia sp. (ex Adelges kitamiensis) TaxID=2864218 RepID=UPI001CE2C351|nr:isoleucine--tRNA ligase [Candidatus Profftia sp. (ex Adelges kitamiensis)]